MTLMINKKIYTAALALLLLLPLSAWAAPVGTFTKIEGRVDILRTRGGEAAVVRVGDPVNMGDAIRTKQNSKAEIQFKDDSVIQLAPETRITIDEYSFRGEVRERGMIGLFRGKLRAIVSKLRASVVPASMGASNFNIKTPTAIAGVRGTDLIVFYERGHTGVVFLDGTGFVYNPSLPDRIVPISGGQATVVPSGTQPPQAAFPISDSFVAPYLKETTIALTGEGGTPGTNPLDMTGNVTGSNTNYTALTGNTLGDLVLLAPSGDSPVVLLVNSLGPGGLGGPVIPPSLLTQVKVTVTVPGTVAVP